MPQYSDAKLNWWFGTTTVSRGKSYVSRVLRTWWSGTLLLGEVQGSRPEPYEVSVYFETGAQGRPRGVCSCPMVGNCKHVVAVLLADTRPDPPGMPVSGAESRTGRGAAKAAKGARSKGAEAEGAPFSAAPANGTASPGAGARQAGRTAGATAAPAAPAKPELRPELKRWLDDLGLARLLADSRKAKAAKPVRTATSAREVLAYAVTGSAPLTPRVHLFKVKPNRDGQILSLDTPWDNVDQALIKPPAFINEQDIAILRLLRPGWKAHSVMGCELRGSDGAEALKLLLQTGRVFAWPEGRHELRWALPQPLTEGAPRTATLRWEEVRGRSVRARVECGLAESLFLAVLPWWYVDLKELQAGPLELPCEPEVLERFLAMPEILLDEVPLVGAQLAQLAPAIPPPPAAGLDQARVVKGPPLPLLLLDTRRVPGVRPARWMSGGQVDVASVAYDYAGLHVDSRPSPPLLRNPQGELVRLERDTKDEHRRLEELISAGLVRITGHEAFAHPPLPEPAMTLADATHWPAFMGIRIPELRAKGWQVVMSEEFRHNVIVVDAVDGTLHEQDEGWFEVQVGVNVEGKRVRIEPLLTALFARDARWLSGGLDRINDNERIELHLPQGGRLAILAVRLKPLVRALIDLFQDSQEGDADLRVSRWDQGRIELLAETGHWQFAGRDGQQGLEERLRESPRVQPLAAPAGLAATLRPYQLEGLAWLQFLRAQSLGGVLADDMGLGKTVQTLAHLLVEKEQGRLDRPALIVMPTSLVPNWRAEAARFAPGLRVLDLHGATRHERFARVVQSDLVLATYPLIWRDQEALAAYEYHLLILDEAQQVKNAATRTSDAIRRLSARHRLCLTGTPLENHLGELWSQFNFLMPGFLGSQRDFGRRWRQPVEKGRDTVRATLLARRVRPFLLRRRKDEVASELPPKVETVREVELEEAQRDLYETVRASMQREVLQAVAAQGLGRSHIVLLEALLKLRQVCCDPRLVRGAAARKVGASAKLVLLLDMLESLVEEGRRILVFSQFTSMLALIAPELDRRGIDHVTLTGDTRDRETPVARFQSGAVPVFLVSLKAGGVGLNLTAADTVIHYDPWWNPAVEQQATDRAHRIGQQRQVFVYKLIAAGTVEEKIMALQARKSALASAILDGEGAGAARFTDEDLQELFAPLPEVPGR